MLRVFLVPVGVSLSEDLPPTANVAKLHKSLAQQCGVASKDVILLTAKGHLLDSTEIIGSYDGGTEERPFFVYFRPGITPNTSYMEPSFKKNVRLEQAMYRITASPSPGILQQQTSLAKEFAQEGTELVHCSQQMHTQTQLLWAGWQALLLNFSSMQRTFEKRQRNLDSAVRNFKESKLGYKNLLEKTPGQLEVLKQIVLPSFMSQSVFGNETHSLYNWINLQDEKSSLEELLKECNQALIQVNEDMIVELQQIANNLTVSAAELYQRETQDVIRLEDRGLEHISTEQKSTAQSLQATVQKALGSGDAGTLASISLSNCQLLKLMYTNHQKLEASVADLDKIKTTIKERIRTGLKSLAKLQQNMTEIDTKIQFQCGQMQLIRRKFEVLEQVCAAPDMMKCVLEEINQRKAFKQLFIKEGEKVKQKFDQVRQKEKSRRERFLEKCRQHFVLSLFPSLTDRIPHLINSVPQKFDDEVYSLPTDELNELFQIFPLAAGHSSGECLFTCDGSTQTDNQGNDCHILTRDSAVQMSVVYNDVLPPQQELPRHSIETGTQTNWNTTNTAIQTTLSDMKDNNTQVMLELTDNCTQMEALQCSNVYTQCSVVKESVGLQTDLAGIQQKLKMYIRGLETAVQTSVTTTDTSVQVSPQLSSIFTQSDQIIVEKEELKISEKSIQTIFHPSSDVQTQTNMILKHNFSQTHFNVSDNYTQTKIVLEPVLVDTSSQTQYNVSDNSTQTDLIRSQLVNKGIDDLEGQVLALQRAVEGLQNQLMSEREEHTKRQAELERGWRHMRRSMHDSQEMPLVISITNLKVGDSALFLQDTRGNFLALSFDDRIYYLSHISAEKLSEDISSKSYIPLKRKVFFGCITEKILVQVQKERNRLQVPVGQRLYKLSAQEMPLY